MRTTIAGPRASTVRHRARAVLAILEESGFRATVVLLFTLALGE